MLGRVELPQVESPSLTRENPAEEHDLDHVDKLDFRVHHVLDAGLESSQLNQRTPGQALLFPGGTHMGTPNRNLGAAAQLESRGSVM